MGWEPSHNITHRKRARVLPVDGDAMAVSVLPGRGRLCVYENACFATLTRAWSAPAGR